MLTLGFGLSTVGLAGLTTLAVATEKRALGKSMVGGVAAAITGVALLAGLTGTAVSFASARSKHENEIESKVEFLYPYPREGWEHRYGDLAWGKD